MSNQKKDNEVTDQEIRDLVLLRLEALTPDSIKTIGGEGTFNKEELIKNVIQETRIGKIIEEIEIEWMQAQSDGIIDELLAG